MEANTVLKDITPLPGWCLCMRIEPEIRSKIDVSALDLSNKTTRRELALLLRRGERTKDGRLHREDSIFEVGSFLVYKGFVRYTQDVNHILCDDLLVRRDDLFMMAMVDARAVVTLDDTAPGFSIGVFGEFDENTPEGLRAASVRGADVLEQLHAGTNRYRTAALAEWEREQAWINRVRQNRL